jgi:hypothetical protein
MTNAADLPNELSAVDAFMHRGEAHPRSRMGTMGVAVLDTTPDWDRYLNSFEQASRRLLRHMPRSVESASCLVNEPPVRVAQR